MTPAHEKSRHEFAPRDGQRIPQRSTKEYPMNPLIVTWADPPETLTPAHVGLLAELRVNPGRWARVTVKLRVATKIAREHAGIEARYVATGTPDQAIYLRAVAA